MPITSILARCAIIAATLAGLVTLADVRVRSQLVRAVAGATSDCASVVVRVADVTE